MSNKLEEIRAEFNDINIMESPHLSLSKTFILKHHWIESFTKTLHEQFESTNDGLFLSFDNSNLLFLSNEEKTRHFACLPVDELSETILKSITNKIDKCLDEFKLPKYYEDPKFHVSVLWKLQEFTEIEKQKISSFIKKSDDNLELYVNDISFKTGNKLFSVKI